MDIAIVVVVGPQDRFLVHQRRPDKRLYPRLWGLGAGGKLDEGESAESAAARELREETGLAGPLEALCTFDFHDPSESLRHRIHAFLFRTSKEVHPVCSEWTRTDWVEAAEVSHLALCPDTRALWQRIEKHWST